MNKDQQRFEEQDAPLKNTDKAFVKVNKDGSPDKGSISQDKDTSSNKETMEGRKKGQDRR
ncbi:hypothetical protein [Flavisolibacter ginsengisoli]|jgi:hypothetical protein|uniref:Uncharacterized protein n=1 Tax=Flavisolibacter ginsengisoli DSM 18119 TaxID=1121884 RepID=A0A1M5FX10_9BACT|nr:hypothetical protein [Flavisolibacter ginsengisoli]SHF96006.1 hypothetical protein SAMN02745131_03974 [Flavisolibacter ginsengisoli DSM 18119]